MRRLTRRALIGGAASTGLIGLGTGGVLIARQRQTNERGGQARLAYLGSDSRPGMERLATLLSALNELGYVEGRNLTMERRLSRDQTGAVFPQFAEDVLASGARVIVTSSTPALLAAAQATQSVPIVASGPNRSLQDLKLIESLARPGRNVTGLEPHPGLDARGVELLADMVPGLTRVAYMRNAATAGGVEQARRAERAARELGLDFLDVPVRAPNNIDQAFEQATAVRAGGLVVQGDLLFGDPSDWRVVGLATRYRLPAVYTQTAGYVDQGGLMAYASDYNAFHRRAATFVDKLLRGAQAAELPVEQTMTSTSCSTSRPRTNWAFRFRDMSSCRRRTCFGKR